VVPARDIAAVERKVEVGKYTAEGPVRDTGETGLVQLTVKYCTVGRSTEFESTPRAEMS
jgi:hypothetical protein